jgi:hypothetical protein
MMKKLTSTVALALSVGLVTSAYAGERTGNGGFTPIENIVIAANPVVRNAICAFSGLEDNDGGAVNPGDTQTPHEEGGVIQEPGVARICRMLNYGKLK